MRWAIEIQKTSLDDRILLDLLKALKINVVQGINFPKAFSSLEIDNCSTAQDAIEIARRVRSTLKTTQTDPEFSIGAVIDFSVDPPISHHFLEVDSCFINVSTFFPATLTVYPPTNLSSDEFENWIKNQEEQQYQYNLQKQLSTLIPAYYNPNAKEVLKLLSIEPMTALNIWKMYEYIRGNREKGADEKIQNDYGITKNEFFRFKDRIHNKSVSGDYARHATDEQPQTDNPMSKAEAEEFIRNLAKKWLTRIRKEYEESRK